MGLHLIKHDININFIGKRHLMLGLSLLFILAGIVSLAVKGGPRYGIDFAGGTIIQVRFEQRVDLDKVEKALAPASLPGLVVQSMGAEGGSEYLLRTSTSEIPTDQLRKTIDEAFKATGNANYSVQRVEMVGPKVGADLRSKALEALFYAVLLISIYISGRFEKRWMVAGIMAASLFGGIFLLKLLDLPMGILIVAAVIISLGLSFYLKLNYALGAIVACIHDVLIPVGLFSVMNVEFDLTVVAALLTITGYSLNDTIIVYDRIRENLQTKKYKTMEETVNRSINQTLSRTLLTSCTTLLTVLCLYLLGGSVIRDFALALLIGISVGTYSSIFVASPILLGFKPKAPAETEAKAAA
jgi:preprotein translocase subunit SecF